MPISSLPSNYGIGTFGKAAYQFADFLKAAGQKYWQILPLVPTSYGDSPYAGFSTFAGNPYFIDLDMLIKDGLLKKEEVESRNWGSNARYIDYGLIYENRFEVLRIAKKRGYEKKKKHINAFVEENPWVENYALFMALKNCFSQKCWIEWPDEGIRMHQKAAVDRYTALLREDIEFFTFVQYLFFTQWNKLKKYINGLGIKIIGDLPIYVALDSADVWSEAKFFELDEKNYPVEVAGVPPDYFSEDGQLWGNPVYDWETMEQDGFNWWLRRIEGASKLYDVIRIDHFRGFDEYWTVKYGATTAKGGMWKKGPGMKLVGLFNERFPDIDFIAEDLGQPSPTVVQLLKDSNWPGMKVLEFAFDSDSDNPYQPHNYDTNCICYTGTHDNATIIEWFDTANRDTIQNVKDYFGINAKEGFNWGVIRGGMGSVAKLFIAQMQDYLSLGTDHRINLPGTSMGNWQWRMLESEFHEELSEKIYEMTFRYGRVKKEPKPPVIEKVEKTGIFSFVKRLFKRK